MDLLKNWFGKKGIEVINTETWETKKLGNLVMPESIDPRNAFILANSVPELFFPIDFYADRISKLRFFIAKDNGKEMANTELKRLVSNEMNPFFSFSDLIYAYVFSMYSEGNAYNYITNPFGGNPDPNNITRWDVLQPNMVSIEEFSNKSLLFETDYKGIIKKVDYCEDGAQERKLDVNSIHIHNVGAKRRKGYLTLADSMLMKANKSIDILLSVYSARYNIYANNGAAGYLSRKVSGSGNSSFESAIMDGSKRDEIIEDINSRHGLTGRRNLWGISGIPIEFVKTIASISELMPFDETLESSIKIASVYQIPPQLVPRKDNSTYDNQAESEQNVWDNALLSAAQGVCDNLTRMFGLSKYKMKVGFDASSVAALSATASKKESLLKAKIENLEALKRLNPNMDFSAEAMRLAKENGYNEIIEVEQQNNAIIE